MIDQRRAQRFDIALPLRLVRNGARPVSVSGQTLNLSSRGVLFTSDVDVSAGERIEYVISLPAGEEPASVSLHCLGKVVRTNREPDPHDERDAGVSVAATLERYEFVRA